MFGALIVLMASGIPIAFAFGVLNLGFLYVLVGPGAVQAIALSSFTSIGTFAFIALPLFVLMGELVLHSGLAASPSPPSASGWARCPAASPFWRCWRAPPSAPAAAPAWPARQLWAPSWCPRCASRGYDTGLAVGTLATSGGLAVLIPPSALMVIFGGISQLSVGDLLIGGILPGLLLATLLFGYIVIICTVRPDLAPAVELEKVSWSERLNALLYFLPLVVLVLVVLGSIFMGIATPSESAAMGVAGAFCLAVAYRRLSWEILRKALLGTVEVSGFALLIVTSATAFSQILAHSGAAMGLSMFATELPVSPWIIIASMQIVILIMGAFMEPISIMLITVPIFFPVIRSLGLDPLWFAIVTMVNIELSLITPPFGMNLFVLKASPRPTSPWAPSTAASSPSSSSTSSPSPWSCFSRRSPRFCPG